jgi:hypothetical protein
LSLSERKERTATRAVPTKILVRAIHELPLLIFKQNPSQMRF